MLVISFTALQGGKGAVTVLFLRILPYKKSAANLNKHILFLITWHELYSVAVLNEFLTSFKRASELQLPVSVSNQVI